MFESMMEWKGFELEGDSLRDSFASRTSKIFKAGDRRRLYKSEGEKVRSYFKHRLFPIKDLAKDLVIVM